jgi:impB/mucB/samB family protein
MSFLSLFMPNFQLQAALRDHALGAPADLPNETDCQRPAGLIDERDKKPVILQLNQAAESAGVTAGMSPSQALARCLDLLILPHSSEQELSVQEILLEKAFTLSPYVEATAPGLCTVQFLDRRDRTDAILHVLKELEACRLFARAGAGPTPDVSYLAAHRAEPLLVVDDTSGFLAPLPLEVLLCNLAEVRPA